MHLEDEVVGAAEVAVVVAVAVEEDVVSSALSILYVSHLYFVISTFQYGLLCTSHEIPLL